MALSPPPPSPFVPVCSPRSDKTASLYVSTPPAPGRGESVKEGKCDRNPKVHAVYI